MEQQLETLIHSVEDAIISVDDRSTIAFLNDAAARLFGCMRAAAVGKPISSVPGLPEVVAQLKVDELTPSDDSSKSVRRIPIPQAGGDPVSIEARVSCVQLDGRKLYTAVMRDSSLQQEMERAIYEARKTQAIGALAGGIAHDFNNILTAVISQVDLVLTAPELPASLRDHLIYAQTSARRGAELVSKLQGFSMQGKPQLALLEVPKVIDQVVFMLRRTVDAAIQLRYQPPSPKPWPVKADGNQLMQALLNLGLNARDAMPAGGQLTIETANLSFDATARPPRKAGDFVRLTVADTGRGMSPETLSRVFEPYFSTKDASRGPGLGLSIASATIVEHGGWMEAESRAGEGTRFHIHLPRSHEPETAPRQAPVADPKTMEGRERILIVDDEEMVRMVTKAVLAYRGYQIVEAVDGEEAIKKYANASPAFDLVLMDVHMPRLNGHDALVKIRALNPKARAVMLSGGLHDAGSEGAMGLEGVKFLHKPFENQELVRLVRETLDARPF